jgi:hypothetical protein
MIRLILSLPEVLSKMSARRQQADEVQQADGLGDALPAD